MTSNDRKLFSKLITDLHAFYRADCTPFALTLWWEVCKSFELDVVREAITRHAANTECGQFCPKPADIVALLKPHNPVW